MSQDFQVMSYEVNENSTLKGMLTISYICTTNPKLNISNYPKAHASLIVKVAHWNITPELFLMRTFSRAPDEYMSVGGDALHSCS